MTNRLTLLITATALLLAACGNSGGGSGGGEEAASASRTNSAPTADAGTDISAEVGSSVALDGSQSSDPEGDPLSHRWTLVRSPLLSEASLSDNGAVRPSFAPDRPGTYVFSLVVDDGRAASIEDVIEVTASFSPSLSNPDELEAFLIADFDGTMDSLGDQNPFVRNGYLLSDDGLSSSSGLHYIEAGLVPIPSSYTNVPSNAGFAAEPNVFDYRVVVSTDLGTAYISETDDFSNCTALRVYDELPGARDWFLFSTQEGKVTFRYAHIYYNTDFVESLCDMYRLTGNARYLQRAELILRQLVYRIYDDDKIRRHFKNEDPYYNGMTQAYVMRALSEYLYFDPENAELANGLARLADSYQITTEGVWNHWNNALMGGVIRDQVKRKIEMDYGYVREKYGKLADMILDFEGRIPKTMSETSPLHPYFSNGYQAYDTKLIAQFASRYARHVNLKIHERFEDALRVSIEYSGQSSSFRPQSVLQEAMLYSLEAFGYRHKEFQDAFLSRLLGLLSKEPELILPAVYRCRTISLYLRYRQMAKRVIDATDVDSDGVPDAWELQNFGNILSFPRVSQP